MTPTVQIIDEPFLQDSKRLVLPPHTIHLYFFELDAKRSLLLFEAMLDCEERRRAERFYFEIHRKRFKIAHGMLRVLLGRYLNCDPTAVKFRFNSFGKPELFLKPGDLPLFFNLSHAEENALIGVSSSPLGVDLEIFNPERSCLEIAKKNFSEFEFRSLQEMPWELQLEQFYKIWVCKEAVFKGVGKGLSLPLDAFELEIDHFQTAVNWRREFKQFENWTVELLDLKNFSKGVGAVAYERNAQSQPSFL